MIKNITTKLIKKDKKKIGRSSEFSRFIREASYEERKRVFLKVARKASKEQQDLIDSVQLTQ